LRLLQHLPFLVIDGDGRIHFKLNEPKRES
jgi:hypothetical protein